MIELVPASPRGQLSGPLTQRTGIVASTLETMEQAETMAFFREFPKLGRACILRHYPLTSDQLRRYADVLNWGDLSRADSASIVFSREMINEFESRWEWGGINDVMPPHYPRHSRGGLSLNPKVLWSIELLERNAYRLDWIGLSHNDGIPWSIEIIDHFRDKWSWSFLSYNDDIPWSLELIEHFNDQWDWSQLSANPMLPWSADLIERFHSKWNWQRLSRNNGVEWSPELQARFPQWSGDPVSKWFTNAEEFKDAIALMNIHLTEQIKNIFEASSRNDQETACGKKYSYWYRLSEELALPWSFVLIDAFKEHWNWKVLSCNPSLP
jgi:hypothetical protein